jgi:type III pantothenate kinase
MLLALDAGNTQTVTGLYDGADLVEHWRTTTVRTHTADELALELRGLLELRGRSRTYGL